MKPLTTDELQAWMTAWAHHPWARDEVVPARNARRVARAVLRVLKELDAARGLVDSGDDEDSEPDPLAHTGRKTAAATKEP